MSPKTKECKKKNLMCSSRTSGQTALDFRESSPNLNPITLGFIGKLLSKVKETGSMLNKLHVSK